MKLDSFIDVDALKSYVLSKRANDGGFSFCKPLPSSLPETYYAVFILKILNEYIDNKEKLVSYLHSSLRYNPHSVYFVLNTLNLLNEKLPDVSEFAINRLRKAMTRVINVDAIHKTESGITATYSFDMPNVLREVYLLTSVLRLLKVECEEIEQAKKFVEMFRKDGGYGVKLPNLEDSFYCVYVKGGDKNIVHFVMKREWKDGGFCKVPNSYPPYIEDTYYAIEILHCVGYNYNNIKTLKYIAKLQNADGGFRRSIYLGTSSLEFSYYAVSSMLRML